MKKLIAKIKTGNRKEVIEAQKKIESYWHGICHPLSKKKIKKYEVFLDEIEYFDEIKDIDHQAYFINTLKWPFFIIGAKHFRFFSDFIIKCIQNPSGKIRQAILHATDWLTMGTDIEIPQYLTRKFSQEDLALIKKNKELYFEFVWEVERLIEKYDEPRFKKYKYIDQMPSSIYKSLQYLVAERLLRTEKYEAMYQDFLRQRYGGPVPKRPFSAADQVKLIIARQQILMKRKEIGNELTELLKETKSDFTLGDVKEAIYNEEDSDDIMKVVAMFDRGGDASELENILELISDAWNYFPHKILGGLSPAEKLLEYQ